jgi:molybdopterin converting factor small subunit
VDVRLRSVNVAATESMTLGAGTITVHIPGPLRNCCAGAAELALSATSLRAVLEDLEQRYPALHRSVCDETGAVRRHVNLFVNTHHMRDRNGLDTPLVPGDEVIILPAVSGG